MKLSCIVAASRNLVIGRANTLPWHLSADLKRFKQITTGHCVILGRKNYEDIGRPLPNRKNLVLTRKANFEAPGCEVFGSLAAALEFARNSGEEECFIVGGAELYRQALPLCERLYLTWVEAELEGDVFLPELGSGWVQVSEEKFPADERNDYATTFCVLERKLIPPRK